MAVGAGRVGGGLLAGGVVGLGLAAWQWLAPRADCPQAWLLPAVAWLVLSWALARPALERRACLLDCLLQPDSRWRRLRGRVWIPLRAAVGAAVVTAALALESLEWSPAWTVGVLSSLAVLGVSFVPLREALRAFRPRWRAAVAAVVLGRGYAALALGLFAAVQFFSPPPFVLYPDLVDTVRAARPPIQVRCGLLEETLRLRAELSAAGWWLSARGGEWIRSGWLYGLVWAGFLLSGGLAFFGLARITVELAERLSALGGGGAPDEAP